MADDMDLDDTEPRHAVEVEWVFTGELDSLYLACEHQWQNAENLELVVIGDGPAPKLKLTVTRLGGPVLVPVEVLEFIRTCVQDPDVHPRQIESIVEAITVLLEPEVARG